jgi:hypothetical protein
MVSYDEAIRRNAQLRNRGGHRMCAVARAFEASRSLVNPASGRMLTAFRCTGPARFGRRWDLDFVERRVSHSHKLID